MRTKSRKEWTRKRMRSRERQANRPPLPQGEDCSPGDELAVARGEGWGGEDSRRSVDVMGITYLRPKYSTVTVCSSRDTSGSLMPRGRTVSPYVILSFTARRMVTYLKGVVAGVGRGAIALASRLEQASIPAWQKRNFPLVAGHLRAALF